MFVVLAYDVSEKRVAKVLKVARKYLVWVQNSVLEGDLSRAKFEMLKLELKKVTTREDHLRFYIVSSRKTFHIEDLYKGVSDSRDSFIV